MRWEDLWLTGTKRILRFVARLLLLFLFFFLLCFRFCSFWFANKNVVASFDQQLFKLTVSTQKLHRARSYHINRRTEDIDLVACNANGKLNKKRLFSSDTNRISPTAVCLCMGCGEHNKTVFIFCVVYFVGNASVACSHCRWVAMNVRRSPLSVGRRSYGCSHVVQRICSTCV